MKVYCYVGSCRESVLSGHGNLVAIGLLLISVFRKIQIREILGSVFCSKTWHQIEAKCYRGSCRQLVLSDQENSEAVGLEFSILNASQKDTTLVEIFSRICVSYHDLETRWKDMAIEIAVENQFYLNMKNQQLSDYNFWSSATVRWTITWICFSQHKLNTKWKRNVKEIVVGN